MSIPTRPLGKTGVNVPIICLGGWHIGQPAIGDAEAERIMHAAVDHGVTFFDNAWDYHEGRSEEIMGKALATGGRRQKVFLMTKNCGRDAATSRQHLDDSLRRLQTDVIDLWQFHEINYDNDPEWIVERGALAVALEAQKAGKVRFIGFTGHKAPHIFLKMLGKHDNWDTCQLPVNVCDYFYRSSIHDVIPELKKKNVAAIGMKSLGGGNMDSGGRIVAGGVATVEECVRFALSQDVASLVVGIDSMKVLMQDVAIARDFKPMPRDESDALLARVRPFAGDGRFEWSKSTQAFDGPYHRRQHGFAE
ncbi:MAG: aldo/keto reductase [Planctomycetes bacterium]|nr:aldo/keto reductase [Planctomycetota bacterium]